MVTLSQLMKVPPKAIAALQRCASLFGQGHSWHSSQTSWEFHSRRKNKHKKSHSVEMRELTGKQRLHVTKEKLI